MRRELPVCVMADVAMLKQAVFAPTCNSALGGERVAHVTFAASPAAWEAARTLLCLPDELLTVCLAHCVLTDDYAHAARSCTRLLAAAEAASKTRLNSEVLPAWNFVPLEASLALRSRLALGYSHACNDDSFQKLLLLGAGVVILGHMCAEGGSAWRAAQGMADLLNGPRATDDPEGCYKAEALKLQSRSAQHNTNFALYAEERDADSGWSDDRRQLVARVTQLSTNPHPLVSNALAVAISRDVLGKVHGTHLAPGEWVNKLSMGVIASELLHSPWYFATDIWQAIRLGRRPAWPADGPLVVVKTVMGPMLWTAEHNPAEEPHTTIEVRDATHNSVLARARLGYSTADNRSAPVIFDFSVFESSSSEDTLVEAATHADCDRAETRQALADVAASSGVAAANMHAARILLWRGVEAFCSFHGDPDVPDPFGPLLASPELIGTHGDFFSWRGMTFRRDTVNYTADGERIFSAGGWASVAIGNKEGRQWGELNSSEEELGSGDEYGGGGEAGDGAASGEAVDGNASGDMELDRLAEYEVRRRRREEKADKARAKAVAKVMRKPFVADSRRPLTSVM